MNRSRPLLFSLLVAVPVIGQNDIDKAARDASAATMQAFADGLQAAGHGVVPVLQVDVRKRADVLQALGVLVSMLSLRSESP